MTACRLHSLRRSALVLVALLFSAARGFASQPPLTDFFAQLDGAPLVLTATAGADSASPAPGIVLHDLTVRRVLKGSLPAPPSIVVEDLVFPSDRSLLNAGTEWLIALEPLPTSSRYAALPHDTAYWRIRGWRHGIRSADAVAAVEPYLAAAAQPDERQRSARLDALIAALSSAAVGDDALDALAADSTLARDLSDDQSRQLASALQRPTMPLGRRRAMLELAGERRLIALVPAVRTLLAEAALAPFARNVLADFGEAPSPEMLRADLERSDPSARASALAAARALPPADRLVFLGDVATNSDDYDVRCAAIAALVDDGHAAVSVLADLLHDSDRRIAAKAATALAQTGGDDALTALSGTFGRSSYDTQVVAVFALRDIGSPEAMRILRQVRAAPPDPRLEKALDLALGINTHVH